MTMVLTEHLPRREQPSVLSMRRLTESSQHHSHLSGGETEARRSGSLPVMSPFGGGGAKVPTPVCQTLSPSTSGGNVTRACRRGPGPTQRMGGSGEYIFLIQEKFPRCPSSSARVPPFLGTESRCQGQRRGGSAPGCLEPHSSGGSGHRAPGQKRLWKPQRPQNLGFSPEAKQ